MFPVINTAKITTLILVAVFLNILPVEISNARGAEFKRSIEDVSIPDVVLLNQSGKRLRLKSFLDADKPVVVDFIFATCTTICPVLSAGVANVQKKFTAKGQEVQLVSITIDPENDTPQVLNKYLQRYRAKPGWDFLTGSRNDIDKVMESFDAFFSDKMDHLPLYFISTKEKGKWIRIEGFIDGESLMAEINKV